MTRKLHGFTTAEVVKLADIPSPTLIGWIDKGCISPMALGSNGRGNTHRFTPLMALGIAIAYKLQQSERGCCYNYAVSIVNWFAKAKEADLIKHFDRGATHLITTFPPAFDGPRYPDMINVETLHKRIQEAIKS